MTFIDVDIVPIVRDLIIEAREEERARNVAEIRSHAETYRSQGMSGVEAVLNGIAWAIEHPRGSGDT